ncbi:MAG: endonuclease domain-containing protein [Mycobacteriaceae bacterium]
MTDEALFRCGSALGCGEELPAANFAEEQLAVPDRRRTCRFCVTLSQHGMTGEQYDALLMAQGFGCAVCLRHVVDLTESPQGGRPRRDGTSLEKVAKLIIDHDYQCCPAGTSCGKCLRGLICHSCNELLASAREDREVLVNAVEYLDFHATARR